MAVDPADCSLCEAPPCFRYALTQALEGACTDYTPTNWRGFSEYYMIDIKTPSTSTPEDMVTYWIDSHPSKHTHTIKAVKKYAQDCQHVKLLDRIEYLMKGHLVDNYKLKPTPQQCLAPCEKCIGWNSMEHQSMTTGKDSCEHHCVSYNGPVTNYIYNIAGFEDTTELKAVKTSTSTHTPSHAHTCTKPLQDIVGKASPNNQKDVLQDLGYHLFDTFPYCHLQTLYHGKTKEALRILVIIFLLYQGMSVMIMSLCENGGLFSMFKTDEKDRYSAIVCHLISFTLRFLLRVVTPLCFSWHIPIMASKPLIPRIGLTRAQALLRVFKVHETFSSEEEIAELQESPENVFERSEEMSKRRIKSIWVPMTNAVFLVTLLLYLGAFLACESNTMKGGVCKCLDRTIVILPLVHVQIHLLIMVESFSVFVTMLLAGIAANCYYHENTIAKYAVTIGKEAESVHYLVRRRWVVMDWYSMLMPLVLASVTLFSLSTGQPFTPAPNHRPEANELVDWYFWIINLTVLQYLGFSSNRMTKSACLWGYLLSAVFVYWVEVEVINVPYGSILVLLYCGLTAISFNLLYSQCVCHLCHAQETGSLSSYVKCVCCVLSLCVLMVSLVVTVYREVAHLATYVVHML